MSYTLFLLLNVNHDRDEILDHLQNRLERTSETTFCMDESPEIFFTVEYLHEETDTSLLLDIPFGAEESIMKSVMDLISYVEEKIQVKVFDPQLGKMLNSSQASEIIDRWKKLNLEALHSYSDGHHFMRTVEEREGRKVMIEAIKFKEETWQNHCSVGLAFSRVGHAAEAQKHFERALELDPENPGIMHALGVTFFNLREYQKAKALLSASLQADPQNGAASELINDCNAKLSLS